VVAKEETMGIGVSLILIAVGAILAFAVDQPANAGVNLDAVGVILMIVGMVGIVISMLYWGSIGTWFPGRSYGHSHGGEGRSETVVVEREVPRYHEVERVAHDDELVDDVEAARHRRIRHGGA
jgi:hypothetical protein